jgi:hypothetical protein
LPSATRPKKQPGSKPTDPIYSDKEIAALVAKLNACNRLEFQWSPSRAINDSIDLFDDRIDAGEPYYRLSMGGNRSDDVKLSRRSMERFLFAVFAPGPHWEQEADQAIADRMDKVRRIIDGLRPP